MATREEIQQHLNRIEGQIKGINKMYSDQRVCMQILQQIVAVRASLAKLGVELLQQDMTSCLQANDTAGFDQKLSQLFKLT